MLYMAKQCKKIKEQTQCKACKQWKSLFEIKSSYMSQKIFNINLVTIWKNKVTLTPHKPAYNGICLLELSKVLTYNIHYDIHYDIPIPDYYPQTLIF